MGKKIRVVDLVSTLFSDLQKTEFSDIELVDIAFVKEGPQRYLRVFIDKDGGVSIDDCANISRALNKKIDAHDPIEENYILEVSSPGVERPLKKIKDFERFAGQNVQIKLYSAINGSKVLEGTLDGYNDGCVKVISLHREVVNVPMEKIASAKLLFTFN